MPPNYGPHEDGRTVFLEQSLLVANVVAFSGYGTSLFVVRNWL